jgi:hypothetical protein
MIPYLAASFLLNTCACCSLLTENLARIGLGVIIVTTAVYCSSYC